MNGFIGNLILHYRITAKLGEGGMGIVYKAEDTRLKREVAIKFLPHHVCITHEEKEKLKTEAQVAAALNHPNLATVYAIEEYNDDFFIVMEYVNGHDLKEFIKTGGGKIKLNKIIEIAKQIAEGLNAAHKNGVVHRDIKSSNIMITDDGRIKITDFGLAEVAGDKQVTQKGFTPGTVAYMPPEQVKGNKIDFRSDIWSFGVVFFEMLTGQLPFQGNFEQAIIYSILHEKPKSLKKFIANIPDELEKIVFRCLVKDPGKRYQSVEELLADLKSIMKNYSAAKTNLFKSQKLSFIGKPRYVTAAIIILLIITSAYFLPLKKFFNPINIGKLTEQLEKMVNQEKYFAAYDLVKEYQKELNNNIVYERLKGFIYDTLSVSTKPEGAKIYLKRFESDKKASGTKGEFIGATPIINYQIGWGDYLVTLEKDGYSSVQRIASSFPIIKEFPVLRHGVNVKAELIELNEEFNDMVFIPGGDYKIVSWSIPDSRIVTLGDFFIDKYEVSNEKYKEFISAGGYVRREYWKHPVYKDGKEIFWKDAMQLFTDRSKLPGPRSWINQEYPADRGNYPVTDITWYEAAAYAEFRGKSLPTVYQWEKASRNGIPNNQGISMPWGVIYTLDSPIGRANFNGKGPESVDNYEFGISAFGCYNMAGNVKEWCRNKSPDGYLQTGGSWEDPYYVYSDFGSYPGLYSSGLLGFRCVKNRDSVNIDYGGIVINKTFEIPEYYPVNSSEFKTLLAFYKYDKKTLNSKILERKEQDFWIKEKVAFDSPFGDRITGYLFLPKNVKKPYQCIVWDPHAGVYFLGAAADWAAEVLYSGNIKSGRALFVIVPKGSTGRPWGYGETQPEFSSILFRDRVVHWVTEQRVGLDYLFTRNDIDTKRITFNAASTGANGFIVPAVDNRFGSVILTACGIDPGSQKSHPEVNPVNFIPRYNAATLMVNGKYDEVVSYYYCAVPVYNLLRQPKEIETVNSGHIPPIDIRVPLTNKWLDKIFGPVKFID
jgi:serine/threonine protein kinase/formylglycine-generating enzyme required for sulfatase activity